MTTAIPDSTGLFPQWQATYAAQGIATFPVTETKQPAITNYPKVGMPGSAELASKKQFARTDAFGFMTGGRSKVTVLDIDSTDEKLLSRAQERHGATPLIVRSGSGKFHAYYRHNGERRRIRPWGRDLPIDLLGVRGFVIAPPSRSSSGAYEIIQGNLSDIDRLPVMRGLHDLDESDCAPNRQWSKLREHDGRNDHLFRQLMREARKMKNADEVMERAMKINEQFAEPLPADEVGKCAFNVWDMTATGRNYFGRHGVFFDAADVNFMIRDDLDMFVMLAFLRANNGSNAKFMATNEWLAETFRWRVTKVIATKRKIIEFGYMHEVSAPRPGRAARYQWGPPA